MNFKPKYDMTVEQNIFVAKRNIVDYIWKSANLEGINVTYPETHAIFEGMSLDGHTIKDINSVNNLKHAWYFILDTLECKTDYKLICEINRKIGSEQVVQNAGFIRNISVSMGGTDWKPDMPIESIIKEELQIIYYMSEGIEKAIKFMLYIMRKKMFTDGNKRTAMLVANHYMISHAYGIISIPNKVIKYFYELLIKFYETNDDKEISQFIYDNCIDGLNFNNQTKEF